MSARAIEIQDPFEVDRAIAGAWTAQERWKRAVRLDPTRSDALDPWVAHRAVAGKSMYDALGDKGGAGHDKAILEAFRAHVARLTLDRIVQSADRAVAVAVNERATVVQTEDRKQVSWREAMHGFVGGSAVVGEASLEALAKRAPAIASVVRVREERRHEAAHRLGLAGVDASFVPGVAYARAAARALLDATEDAAAQTLEEALTRAGRPVDLPRATDVVAIANAKDAAAGWPSRLRSRWLEDLFGAHLRGLAPNLELPSFVAGASTFARALEAFGLALGRALSAVALPFVLADDPFESSAHRLGALFGSLGASARFHRRALGTGARDADKNRRSLAISALFEARVRAARVVLSADRGARDLFEETTYRVFRAPLDERFMGAWPLPNDDDLSRFVAVLRTPALVHDFVERFDEDWFLNPHAFEWLRHARPRAEALPADVAPENAAGEHAHAFARAIEEALS